MRRPLDRPPRGPFRAGFWRSPLRSRWLTSILGLVLLIGLPVVAITGLLSNDAYQPQLGANIVGVKLTRLDFHLLSWPTHPSWLYALTQGAHISIGLALTPVLLAKLWSVIPRLFEWPPVRSPAHALERISLVLLVGSAVFEFVTGIIDIELWSPFGFYFPAAHYYGGLVLIVAFVAHVALKLPTMRQGLRTRRELAAVVAGPERPLASPAPSPPTFSRRALLGTVGAGSVLLLVQGAGQAIGGFARALAFMAPRTRMGSGPNGFPVNHPVALTGIRPSDVDASWRLRLIGARSLTLSREQLLAMKQHTYDLPIACVEGWSTTQRWTGVRLRELAALAGVSGPATVRSVSLERDPNNFNQATLGPEQLADERSLLALRVNGVDLSLDHGYPARVIGPALPGVHCTKWVASMEFIPE